jgi:TolA-binding protein
MKYLIGLLMIVMVVGCKKLAEDEYYTNAKNSYANQKAEDAIENFEGLIEYYPESEHMAEALFMLGFINANDIVDTVAARKYYTEFLEKYPTHELAFSAQYELENLGKDINELPIFKNLEADSSAEVTATN